MKLSQINEALNHNIVGGSEYQWQCYGTNVRFLDFESDFAHATVLFDTVTKEVYEATINAKDDDTKVYRWHNPTTKDSFLNECKERNVDPSIAWDNVQWVDLEVPEDFLEKAAAIINGQSYDRRVTVPINLSSDEMFRLMCLAHERDITLNKLVEEILWSEIKRHKE